MMNKRLDRAFGIWARKRSGGLRCFLATVLLTAATLLFLSRALGSHARSYGRSSAAGANARSKAAEARWRVEMSGKLDELLARVARDVPTNGVTAD